DVCRAHPREDDRGLCEQGLGFGFVVEVARCGERERGSHCYLRTLGVARGRVGHDAVRAVRKIVRATAASFGDICCGEYDRSHSRVNRRLSRSLTSRYP